MCIIWETANNLLYIFVAGFDELLACVGSEGVLVLCATFDGGRHICTMLWAL